MYGKINKKFELEKTYNNSVTVVITIYIFRDLFITFRYYHYDKLSNFIDKIPSHLRAFE